MFGCREWEEFVAMWRNDSPLYFRLSCSQSNFMPCHQRWELCAYDVHLMLSEKVDLLLPGVGLDLSHVSLPIMGVGGILLLVSPCGQPIFRLRAGNEVQGHGLGCGRGKNR